jgi:APA family basic amino acid/polyamine antiporter
VSGRGANGKLLRLLGVWFGVAVILGSTIGTGILRIPGEIALHLRGPWLILLAWALGGLYAMLGAISITELGAAMPQAGGYYVFARRAFDPRIGFTIAWGDWLGQLAAIAFAAIVIGEYAVELMPALAPWKQGIALASIASLAVVQAAGLRASAAFQNWTSFGKALAFLGLAAACFLLAPPARSQPAAAPVAPGAASVVLAAQAIIFAYDGWYTAFYFTEEDRAPERNLLRSMLVGVWTITGIYLLLNAAFLFVLPASELAGSKLAAAQVTSAIFGAGGGRWITILSLISIPPMMSAALLMSTRVLFAVGRDGMLPARAAGVSHGGTPRPAMLLSCAAAALMVISGTAGRLLAIAGFYFVLNYTSAYFALFTLRRKEPELARPYRVWGYPYTTGIVLGVSVAFLASAVWSDRMNSLWALALLAVGEPLRRLLSPRAPGSGG